MTTDQIKARLAQLTAHWRDKAALIENDYSKLSAGQAKVAAQALSTCAEEVEDIIKEIPPSTSQLITTPDGTDI